MLASAAQELSEPKKTEKTQPKSPHISVISQATPEEEDWRAVVQKRIESKTRRFAKGRTQPEPVKTTNKFAPVAGHFVFPLLRNFDRYSVHITSGMEKVCVPFVISLRQTDAYMHR